MPSRARDRQLAKLAARRQAERRAARHRRNLVLGSIAGAAAVVALVAGAMLFFGGDEPSAAASATPSATPSVKTGPCPQTEAPAAASKTKPTFAEPPKDTIDPSKTYVATFETSCGTFSAELLAGTATDAVNSFVFLADKHFFDGLVFHRIVKGFVIQSGDPTGDGTGGPGYEIPVTVTKGSSFDAAGVLAFAHSSVGGNGSQFFVTLAPATNLDPPNGKYTIFGNVTDGLGVVEKIGRTPTVAGPSGEESSPTYPIYILKVTIAES
jgi:cyclophilin family peptidyl-prolyl cis-trans isomerase